MKAVHVAIIGAAVAATWAAGRYLRSPFDAEFKAAAARHDVPFNLLRAIGLHESNFQPRAVSGVNSNGTRDYGVMQINNRTAQHYGVGLTSLLDPAVNIDLAGRYMADTRRELGRTWTESRWVSAYNAGSPTVLRSGIVNGDYVVKVLFNKTLFEFGGNFA